MTNNYRVVLGYLSRVSARPRRFTDPKVIDEIKRLYGERWTPEALGEKYDASKETIKNLLIREGVQMRTQSGAPQKITDPEVIEEIKRLYDEGLSYEALGKKYDASSQAIDNLLKREGVQTRTMSEAARKRHGLEIDDEKVVDLFFNSEWEIRQIARKFNTTHKTIRRILQKYVESQGVAGIRFKGGTRIPATVIQKIIYDYDVLKDSSPVVAQRYGFSTHTIKRVLGIYDIPMRSYSEAQKVRQKKKQEMPKTGSFYD